MDGQNGAALFMLILIVMAVVGAIILKYVERPKKTRHGHSH